MMTATEQTHVHVIAEAGVNHNGDIAMAKRLIDVAAEAGADSVKFQTFVTSECITVSAPQVEYQAQNTGGGESQLEMARKLELDEPAHRILIEHCEKRGVQFMSTAFDVYSVALLAKFNLPLLKLSSGEVTNARLFIHAARTGMPIVLSTGMCTLGDVEMALGILAYGYLEPSRKPTVRDFQQAFNSRAGQRVLKEKVILLHCTTEYPAPFEDVNLRSMDTMHQAFGLPVGLSDHTPGIAIPIAAAARGAVCIEKHFTLDRNLEGPDHRASVEPAELMAMVRSIREVEKALGSPRKQPSPSEIPNLPQIRKSIVASKAIKAGDVLSEENITIKRPDRGISALYYWEWVGKVAARDYRPDEEIAE